MGKQDLYIFFSIVGMSTFRKWTRYIRNGETSTTYQNLNGYLIHIFTDDYNGDKIIYVCFITYS